MNGVRAVIEHSGEALPGPSLRALRRARELPRFVVPMLVSAGPAIEADWALEVK